MFYLVIASFLFIPFLAFQRTDNCCYQHGHILYGMGRRQERNEEE